MKRLLWCLALGFGADWSWCAETASAPARLARGEALARSVCATCHLFPEPNLLTKTEWAHHVLPAMALWLGVEPANYESLPEGKILQGANLFPAAPVVSQEDWFAMWEYYVSSAPSRALATDAKPELLAAPAHFRARKLNFHAGMPSITLVRIDPAQQRVHIGDAYAGLLAKVTPQGKTEETARLGSPPVALTFSDAGHCLTLAGRLFPSDLQEGAVLWTPKRAAQPQPLLTNLRRPTHAVAADLNGDGREDFVVCSFGHRLGRFSWFEAQGEGRFREHVLFDRPGAIRAEVRDFNRDGRPDIMVLMAQAQEGLYVFHNEGEGRFRSQAVVEQHPAFGFAGFELADLNQDGHIDILAANGDNGDFPAPHKRYHGVRVYLNDSHGQFKQAWFYPMEGAYKAVAADFDQDGDLDIAAIAYYPDFERAAPEGLVYLENRGQLQFAPHALPEASAGRWLAMDAGDLDGDGDIDLALGSFTMGPTTIPVPARLREHWRTNGAAVLLLENVAR
jgi:hypothetical protein